jgi:hypothetical protein
MAPPIKPFIPGEIKREIENLNEHKVPGYELITTTTIRQLPRKALVLLTIIFNGIVRLSYFPLTWKFAQIILVHKPGKPLNETISYRPISLLPIPSKLFERLLLTRLQKDVDFSAIIPDYQFGFRKKHSTIQ